MVKHKKLDISARGGGYTESMKKNMSGFTIVELLIVIVVIAILAALSYVAYANIRNRTHDSVVQGDLQNFAKKVELYHAEYGTYPSSNAQLTAAMAGFSVAQDSYDTAYYNFTYRQAIDRDVYVVAAKSKSNKIWFQSSTGRGLAPASIYSAYGGVVDSLIGIPNRLQSPFGVSMDIRCPLTLGRAGRSNFTA